MDDRRDGHFVTGILAALFGTATAAGGGGGGGGGDVPDALNWIDIYGVSYGATDTLTVSGITVPISISVTKSGSGTLSYSLNGTVFGYTGAFLVHVGDTLAWIMTTATIPRSGTLTVVNVTDSSTTLKVINFSLSGEPAM